MRTLTGDIPIELVETYLKLLKSTPIRILSKYSTHSLIAPSLDVPFLAKDLRPAGFTVQTFKLTKAHPSSLLDIDLSKEHDELTEVELTLIEGGGEQGRERLAGAIILTGNSWLEIHCLEEYNRDCHIDPHAEPFAISPSSAPDESSATQYPKRLKIVVIHDGHGNPRLVIGVRGLNYLVTAGKFDGNLQIGPSRCGKFPVEEVTGLHVRRESQGHNFSDVLGLAQVRSSFGHVATFSKRRCAFVGHSAVSQLPVTVFTLSQWGVPQATVFRRLWERFQESGRPILFLDDMTVSCENETPQGKLLRKLRSLFSNSGTLDVSLNPEADRILYELANGFSSTISAKNKIVQSNNS